MSTCAAIIVIQNSMLYELEDAHNFLSHQTSVLSLILIDLTYLNFNQMGVDQKEVSVDRSLV